MLTETQIRAARPRDKPYKLFDERGLYMLVNPDGSRWWRFKYAVEKREIDGDLFITGTSDRITGPSDGVMRRASCDG